MSLVTRLDMVFVRNLYSASASIWIDDLCAILHVLTRTLHISFGQF